jgi:6-phosphogluconate dehydrogenase
MVGYDANTEKINELVGKAASRELRGTVSLQELASRLKRPRAVILLVPAGPPLDSVIEGLLPYLEPSDLLIDSGFVPFPLKVEGNQGGGFVIVFNDKNKVRCG